MGNSTKVSEYYNLGLVKKMRSDLPSKFSYSHKKEKITKNLAWSYVEGLSKKNLNSFISNLNHCKLKRLSS